MYAAGVGCFTASCISALVRWRCVALPGTYWVLAAMAAANAGGVRAAVGILLRGDQ